MSLSPRSRSRCRSNRQFSRRFESLEDRRLLAILTVTTTLDRLSPLVTLAHRFGPDGKLSLREAIYLANINPGPDTVVLGNNTYKITIAGKGEDANKTGDFDILDNLTIAAAPFAHPIVDGNGLDRVFDIPTGHTGIGLTLQGIIVQGGIASGDDGGGIHANSSGNAIKLYNSTVRRNLASNGGGIWNNNGDILLDNSHVDGNSAGFDGGGIYLNSSPGAITVRYSTVSSNNAADIGGGIEDFSRAAFTGSYSQFNNNHAGSSSEGGAGEADSQFFTLTSCTVSGNTSGSNGGGFYVNFGEAGVITITKSAFTNNSSASDGGALFCEGASIVISGSTFKNNSSNSSGGAIDDAGSVQITDSCFDHNTAAGDAGAIHQETSGNITILRSTFTNNVCTDGSGGAIDAVGGTGDVIRTRYSTFTGNSATSDGGAISAGGDVMIVSCSNFKDNTANEAGGAIVDCAAIQVTDSQFIHNVAHSGNGGAIHQEEVGDITVLRSTFSNNQALDGFGGAIAAEGGSDLISITDSCFSYNSSSGDGGAVYANGDSVTVLRSTFDHNSSVANGGAIADAFNSITITDSTLSNNSSHADGGAFNAEGGNIFITRSKIKNNTAGGGNGGGFSSGISTVSIIDSTISGNTALAFGGGFTAGGETLTMTGSTVSGNKAGGNGGGIYIATSELVPPGSLIANCTISGNGAAVSGGGIDFEGIDNLTLINDTIAFNAALNGGGIAQTGGMSNIHIGNTIVALNTATNGPDIFDTVVPFDDLGHNLFFSLLGQGNAGILPGAPNINPNNDIIGLDPLLGPLANNGGPTQTHALLTGSPAINAADDLLAPLTDQRGVTRPQGAHADIGAYEKILLI